METIKTNIPKLRFPEFEEKWNVNNLVNLTEILRCGIASTPEYVEHGVPFLSSQNVSQDGEVILQSLSLSDEGSSANISNAKVYISPTNSTTILGIG